MRFQRLVTVVPIGAAIASSAARSAGLEELVGRKQADQAASIISPQEPSDRPHRPLLRIEFRPPVDLRAIARRDATVLLHSYFCSHQDDFAVLSAPTVYADGEGIRTVATGGSNPVSSWSPTPCDGLQSASYGTASELL